MLLICSIRCSSHVDNLRSSTLESNSLICWNKLVKIFKLFTSSIYEPFPSILHPANLSHHFWIYEVYLWRLYFQYQRDHASETNPIWYAHWSAGFYSCSSYQHDAKNNVLSPDNYLYLPRHRRECLVGESRGRLLCTRGIWMARIWSWNHWKLLHSIS